MLRVSRTKVKFILMLLPFFQPEYFDTIFILGKAYEVLKVFVVAYVVCYFYVNYFRKVKFSNPYFLITLFFCLFLLITTVSHYGNIRGSLVYMLNVLGLSLVVVCLMKENLVYLLEAAEDLLLFWVVINLLTIFIFPNGMYVTVTTEGAWYSNVCWLIGYKNHILTFLFPLLFVNKLKRIFAQKIVVRDMVVDGVVLLTSFIVNCSTGIIGVVLWYVGCIYLHLNPKRGKGFYLINWGMVLLFPLLVVFKIQNNFQFIIETLFNKDITLTKRTYIWDVYLNLVSKSWLVGYGNEYLSLRFIKTHLIAGVNCHNGYLEILYRGGAVLFVVFLLFLVIIFSNIKKLWGAYLGTNIYAVCSLCTFCLLMMMQAELIFWSTPLWLIFSIVGNISLSEIKKVDAGYEHL